MSPNLDRVIGTNDGERKTRFESVILAFEFLVLHKKKKTIFFIC